MILHIITLFGLFLMGLLFYLVTILSKELSKQRPSSALAYVRPVRSSNPAPTAQRTNGSRGVSRDVQVQLLAMVNGDQPTANRLVNHVRQSNPGRSEQWVWERVISDLERDRR